MKTGFYDLSKFKSNEEIKKFFEDCINNSYMVHIDYLDKKPYREARKLPDLTIENVVEKLASLNTHNVFIDRQIQYKEGNTEFEAGFCTLSSSIYVFIYICRELGEKLVEKYKLEMT